MSLKAQINNDLKDAMRAKDKPTLDTLRLVMAAIKQIEVDERIDVDDTRLLVILDKMTKQRHESISQFQAAGRTDLVNQEELELGIIKKYMPEPLSEEAILILLTKAITDVGATKMADMGKVMNELKPQLQGRADMAKVSALIKAKLN